MKQTTKLALTLLTGFALGGGAIGALKAQGNKPPAYVFAEVEVTDPVGSSNTGKACADADAVPRQDRGPPPRLSRSCGERS